MLSNQNKTKQNKTKQNKTKQNKTKQNKTKTNKQKTENIQTSKQTSIHTNRQTDRQTDRQTYRQTTKQTILEQRNKSVHNYCHSAHPQSVGVLQIVDKCGKVLGWTDASEPGTGNWMKYVRSSEDVQQRNVMAVQVDEQVRSLLYGVQRLPKAKFDKRNWL